MQKLIRLKKTIKPKLDYVDHKHIKDKIISSKIPDIEQVILEIITD